MIISALYALNLIEFLISPVSVIIVATETAFSQLQKSKTKQL